MINMFFDADGAAASKSHQDEAMFEQVCTSRAQAGYNSGMGEIFRKVAEISPIVVGKKPLPPQVEVPAIAGVEEGEDAAATVTTTKATTTAAVA